MNKSTEAKPLSCALTERPAGRVVEFASFATQQLPPGSGWPGAPGAVRRGPDGSPLILHFAPHRWLLPGPTPELLATMAQAMAAGAGTAVEVEGKWATLELRGADAARVLASSIDIAAVLDGRECAALTLFDCPAVLVTIADGYRLYVKASYTADFRAAIERLRAATWPFKPEA
jgi:heterotetrameric sarcosine oxidase gamma subunit